MRIAILCLLTAACEILELEATNLRPLVPLAQYVVWHAEVEACVRQKRDFYAIRWFEADVMFFGDFEAGGFWHEPNQITVRSDRLMYGAVVKYELIHYVTQSTVHDAIFDKCSTKFGALQPSP